MVAMNGASVALAPSCARHQPAVTTGTVWPRAITRKARVMTTVPPTIHGRRRPKREVVRSENRPNRTLPMTANSAPKPATVPRAEVFWSSGTICWTFTPMPMIAGPSSAMKKISWAKTRPATYFQETGFVGSANQWCSRGFTTSRAMAALSVGGRSLYGLPNELIPASSDGVFPARDRDVGREEPLLAVYARSPGYAARGSHSAGFDTFP